MKKLLFEKVFDKAGKLSGKTTKNGISEYLAYKITDDFKYSIAGKTFVRYYEKYIEENGDAGNDPRTDLLDVLARYLKYEDFADFISKSTDGIPKKWDEKVKIILKKNKIVIVVCFAAITSVIFINYFDKQRWMVWEEGHYVEVRFDPEKYALSSLKLYNADRIANFQQIIPDCNNTKFFNDDGSVNLWYGKSTGGELEYFTSLGKHPETGKTLRAITQYMIDKYICTE